MLIPLYNFLSICNKSLFKNKKKTNVNIAQWYVTLSCTVTSFLHMHSAQLNILNRKPVNR